jgi:hypothetical protein
MAGDHDGQDGRTTAAEIAGSLPPEIEALQRLLRSRDEEFRSLEREVHALRRQLRAIHTSTGWAVLRTVAQMQDALAPRGSRRDHLARAGMTGLRRLKRAVRGLATAAQARRAARVAPHVPLDPSAYAVVCLPIIEWSFRFQRPQQLMRRFARRGHRVFYAANHLQNSRNVRLRPLETNIVEMVLPGDPTVNVYHQMPTPADIDRMADALARLHDEHRLADAVVVVQLPFWGALAERLRTRFGWALVYDCMDDHSGFHNNSEDVLEGEDRLVALADLVVSSSERLHSKIGGRARHAVLVRNACEYEPFSQAASSGRPCGQRPIIGYYGAIAEWFDGDLVAGLARLRPRWRFELIGSTLSGDVSMLEPLPNVSLLGERPYLDLPRLIGDWDAYVIPFKRVPLTEATNPVKVYEMLATGKPVVAVGLPELVPLADAGLISLAHDPATFARVLERLLADTDPALAERRQAFARQNTWEARHDTLASAIEWVRFAELRIDSPTRLSGPHKPVPPAPPSQDAAPAPGPRHTRTTD